jgi:hypothetical protein
MQKGTHLSTCKKWELKHRICWTRREIPVSCSGKMFLQEDQFFMKGYINISKLEMEANLCQMKTK